MKNVQKQKRANKSLPFFFRDEFKVSLVIILISIALLITTFTFDIVPPILNRGIQPATFPKALLVLIIVMTSLIYYLATKNPWKVEKKTSKIILFNTFKLFDFLGYFKDFRFLFSYFSFIYFCFLLLGRKKNILFIICWDYFSSLSIYFFETILGLRFPPGIITNIYYS